MPCGSSNSQYNRLHTKKGTLTTHNPCHTNIECIIDAIQVDCEIWFISNIIPFPFLKGKRKKSSQHVKSEMFPNHMAEMQTCVYLLVYMEATYVQNRRFWTFVKREVFFEEGCSLIFVQTMVFPHLLFFKHLSVVMTSLFGFIFTLTTKNITHVTSSSSLGIGASSLWSRNQMNWQPQSNK